MTINVPLMVGVASMRVALVREREHIFLTHSLRSRMSCCGQWENGVSRNLRRVSTNSESDVG